MAIQNGQAESQEPAAAALATAPSDVRYAHFVRTVCAAGQLWSLRDADGWLIFEDADGRECVPVWPAPGFAELCATAEFAGSRPEPIPLDVFLKRWLPRMVQDRRVAAVFPTPSNRGVLMPPPELLRELEAARS